LVTPPYIFANREGVRSDPADWPTPTPDPWRPGQSSAILGFAVRHLQHWFAEL